jgi:predicted nuclease with TOPRIM domain
MMSDPDASWIRERIFEVAKETRNAALKRADAAEAKYDALVERLRELYDEWSTVNPQAFQEIKGALYTHYQFEEHKPIGPFDSQFTRLCSELFDEPAECVPEGCKSDTHG